MAIVGKIIGATPSSLTIAKKLAERRGTGPKTVKNWGRLRNESQGNGKARIIRVRPNPEKMAKELADKRGTSPPNKAKAPTQKSKK